MDRLNNVRALADTFGLNEDIFEELERVATMCMNCLSTMGIAQTGEQQREIHQRFRENMVSDIADDPERMGDRMIWSYLNSTVSVLREMYPDYKIHFEQHEKNLFNSAVLYINGERYRSGTERADYAKSFDIQFGEDADLFGRESLSYEDFYNLYNVVGWAMTMVTPQQGLRIGITDAFLVLKDKAQMIVTDEEKMNEVFKEFMSYGAKDDGMAVAVYKNGRIMDATSTHYISFADIVSAVDKIPDYRHISNLWELEKSKDAMAIRNLIYDTMKTMAKELKEQKSRE